MPTRPPSRPAHPREGRSTRRRWPGDPRRSRAGSRHARRPNPHPCPRAGSPNWQSNGDGRSVPAMRGDLDRAAVRGHDLPREEQAQAQAGRLRSAEPHVGLEDERMPGAWSRTTTMAVLPDRRIDTSMVGVAAACSTALPRRLTNTCSRRPGSPATRGSQRGFTLAFVVPCSTATTSSPSPPKGDRRK